MKSNPLVMLRSRGLGGPVFQHIGNGIYVHSQGNAYAPGGPLSGVTATRGVVIDENTVDIYFVPCVTSNSQTGIRLSIESINGGNGFNVSTASQQSSTIVRYTFAPIVSPGDIVKWRYLGGSNSLVDCDEGEDIGPQDASVANDLVLAGDFILMQSGGMDIALVQEDPDGTQGIYVQEKP